MWYTWRTANESTINAKGNTCRSTAHHHHHRLRRRRRASIDWCESMSAVCVFVCVNRSDPGNQIELLFCSLYILSPWTHQPVVSLVSLVSWSWRGSAEHPNIDYLSVWQTKQTHTTHHTNTRHVWKAWCDRRPGECQWSKECVFHWVWLKARHPLCCANNSSTGAVHVEECVCMCAELIFSLSLFHHSIVSTCDVDESIEYGECVYVCVNQRHFWGWNTQSLFFSLRQQQQQQQQQEQQQLFPSWKKRKRKEKERLFLSFSAILFTHRKNQINLFSSLLRRCDIRNEGVIIALSYWSFVWHTKMRDLKVYLNQYEWMREWKLLSLLTVYRETRQDLIFSSHCESRKQSSPLSPFREFNLVQMIWIETSLMIEQHFRCTPAPGNSDHSTPGRECNHWS